MNPISSDIPQLLAPLSAAPIDQSFLFTNTTSDKSINRRSKPKNPQKTQGKNINSQNNLRPHSSKSESIDRIEEKFSAFEDIIRNNKSHPSASASLQTQENPMKIRNTRTVYNFSKNNNYQDNNSKKYNPSGQCNANKPNFSNSSTTSTTNHKMKMSSSQPSMISYSQEQKMKSNNQPNYYDKYWTAEEVSRELEAKTILKGKIRINLRNYEDAFITDPNGGTDIYISGLKDRNRSLNGDVVAIKLKEKYMWNILDGFRNDVIKVVSEYETEVSGSNGTHNIEAKFQGKLNLNNQEKKTVVDYAPFNFFKEDLLIRLDNSWFQRTAFVVSILEKKNSRWAAGHLKLFPDKNKEWALFSPNDSRLPRIKVKVEQCPPDFLTNANFYSNTLFIAQILDIPINSRYAIGELKRCIGREGNIDVETEAILVDNGIDYSDFKEEVLLSLPSTPWKIPDSEFGYRRDLRNVCVFTIDPASARDLDDALHIIKLNDETYEIGVHIADVSYFVTENSPIDKCAVDRTTSVYLVQKVIPMLPRLLCEELCSLNPFLDRLTFSVIWKVKANGDIIDEWFGRTIINSAVKLSYEHAQKFIENPSSDFEANEFPEIRKEFSLNDIKASVLNLDCVAKKLREKRYLNGSLALNQTKISFVLNKELGMPYGYNVYEQKDSNKLVEEFMLLANIAVAHRIYEKYPTKAVLRRHPSPNVKQIEVVRESMQSYGFDCDIKSSGSIQSFLSLIQKSHPIASITLTCLLTKTMQLAQYFCSGYNIANQSKDYFNHYGLAVPLYTHFTSPIRRYPDILVHRLLAASLGYCKETARPPIVLHSISETCNDKKLAARICSEKSSEMFFNLFVNECGPLEEEACIVGIMDHSFDLLLVNLGFVKRVYADKLDIDQKSVNFAKDGLKQEISFIWNSNEKHQAQVNQTIKLFDKVNVLLCKHDSDPLKINITLMHPNEKINRTKEISSARNSDNAYNQRVDVDPYICD